MKNYFSFFFCVFLFSSGMTQEIVLSKEILKFYNEKDKLISVWSEATNNPAKNKEAIEYFNVFHMLGYSQKLYSKTYANYADILAKEGNLQEAVRYYELAFNEKQFTVSNFSYPYRSDFFKNDTLLYQKTLKHFKEKFAKIFSYDEIETMQELHKMLSADQMARVYEYENYNYRNCAKSIVVYTDSINILKIKELFAKKIDVASIINYEFEIGFLLGRHLFTAYPDLWLTYFEPSARASLIEGLNHPQSYARTYDRAIITSGKAPHSYYGEWDNGGANANPDVEAVNRRRVNIGLPLLGDKPVNQKNIFITY